MRSHFPLLPILSTAVVVVVCCVLGVWQLKRLQWKEDLIARVTERVHASPIAAPGVARWPMIKDDEYRHVSLRGHYLHEDEIWVQASTILGRGFWLLSPLQRTDGTIVWINRGFVAYKNSRYTRPTEELTVHGLLRLSEGVFLRHNDIAANRWYARDVQAMAAAKGLTNIAPYFVDAEKQTGNRMPIGGLTVITFPNNHLVYAITWFMLAIICAILCFIAVRKEDVHLR